MAKYILKRILLMIPVILGVVLIVFCIIRMAPGDPATALMSVGATEEELQAKRVELGLDKPFVVQFLLYVKNFVLHFDLGDSYQTGLPVTGEILKRFPITFLLGASSVLISLVIGIPFGIISATKQYSGMDYGVTFVSLILASIPGFWFSLMLILLFALKLQWFPVAGLEEGWRSWVLPILAMGGYPIATICRTTRSSMLEVVRQDYIRTARAKGLDESVVIKRHALRNSLIPIIAVAGLQMGYVIGGTVVIESIFSIPGIGSLLITAITSKDYNIVQGCVLIMSMFICVMNLLVDIMYSFVDPRIKAVYSSGKKLKPAKRDLKEPEEEVA